MSHRGQATVEAVIAALIVTSIFLALFKLSHMLTGKIMVEHAAMRVARARTIGMNEFMCLKAARIAVIPVAGKRTWPLDEEFDYAMERGRFANYLASPDNAVARGILDYDGWSCCRLKVDSNDCTDSRVKMKFKVFDEPSWEFALDGKAGVEDNCQLYLNNQGL